MNNNIQDHPENKNQCSFPNCQCKFMECEVEEK